MTGGPLGGNPCERTQAPGASASRPPSGESGKRTSCGAPKTLFVVWYFCPEPASTSAENALVERVRRGRDRPRQGVADHVGILGDGGLAVPRAGLGLDDGAGVGRVPVGVGGDGPRARPGPLHRALPP